jgi:hypothetical protein
VRHLVELRQGLLGSRPCVLDERTSVGVGAPQLLRDAFRGSARHEGLEVAATMAVPLARRPVRLDDHVPDLRPAAVRAAVEDDPAPDSRAQREQHDRREALPGSELPLGESGRVRVVLDPDRKPEPRPRVGGEVEVVQREIRRAQDATGGVVEVGGNAEADRPRLLVQQCLDRCVERLQDILLRGPGTLDEVPPEDVPLPVGDPREDLRAADVHSDDEGSAHDRGQR